MYLYTEYQTRNGGVVGQADPANIEVRNGVQYANRATNDQLINLLVNQCIDAEKFESSAAAPNTNLGRTQELGTQKVDGTACNESALERLRRAGWIVMADMTTFSPAGVWLIVSTDPDAPRTGAAEGTNYAVLDLKPAVLEAEEKVETTTLLLGAAAGGALGFVTIGPVGGLGGAVGGALIANWLA